MIASLGVAKRRVKVAEEAPDGCGGEEEEEVGRSPSARDIREVNSDREREMGLAAEGLKYVEIIDDVDSRMEGLGFCVRNREVTVRNMVKLLLLFR